MTQKEIKEVWKEKKKTGYLLEVDYKKNPIAVHQVNKESSNKRILYTKVFKLEDVRSYTDYVSNILSNNGVLASSIYQDFEGNLHNYKSITKEEAKKYIEDTFIKYDLNDVIDYQNTLKSFGITISDEENLPMIKSQQKRKLVKDLKDIIQKLKDSNEKLRQEKIKQEELENWSKNAVANFERNKIVFNEKKGLIKQDAPEEIFDIIKEDSQNISVQDIELTKINTDPARFQNRQNDFSSESRDRIVNAYKNGEFNFAKFDPISIWKDPSDNKFYVLSGHSRFAAFKEISKTDKKFAKIPSRIFIGTEKQAIDFALNSNVLSTKETDMERAIYYHKDRQTCEIAKHVNGLGDVVDCEKQTEIKCYANEGKNASYILNLSYLNPEGFLADSMKRIGADKGTDDANIIRTVAAWVGDIRKRFPEVSDNQETEIAKYLLNGGYGSKSTQFKNKEKFILRFRYCLDRWKQRGADPQMSLNIENNLSKSVFENEYDARLEEAKVKKDEAQADLLRLQDKYQAEIIAGRMTYDKMSELLKPYNDYYLRCKEEYERIKGTKDQVKAAASAQMSLFGIGSKKSKKQVSNANKSIFEIEYDARLEEARKKKDEAQEEYRSKHSKYWKEVAYGKLTQERMLELEKPLLEYYKRCFDEYVRILNTKDQVKAAEKAQMSLFDEIGRKKDDF